MTAVTTHTKAVPQQLFRLINLRMIGMSAQPQAAEADTAEYPQRDHKANRGNRAVAVVAL
jgi:hypothetical protein